MISVCTCWRAGQLLVTYLRENRDAVAEFFRGLESFGYREQVELTDFLLNAKVDTKRLSKEFHFTSSLIEVPDGEELYAISLIASTAPPRLLLSTEPNVLFSARAIGGLRRFRFDPQIQVDYRTLVNMSAAHSQGITGSNVQVAILDTGVESAGIGTLPGTNFFQSGSPANDDNGHGSCVAAIINDIAPDATLLPIKIADSNGMSDLWLLQAGIFAANAANAQLTNISLAYGLGSRACPKCGYGYSLSIPSVRSFVLEQSVRAQSNGSLVIAATGNEGNKSAITQPAACPDAIAVAAVNRRRQVAQFSNEDPTKIYYTAPGGDGQPGSVPSEFVGTDSSTGGRFAGTSMAAAYATGVLALLAQKAIQSGNSPLTAKQKLANHSLIAF